MKIYWIYRCDDNHTWEFFRDENYQVKPEDSLCPYGHKAVTVEKRFPIDQVEIAFRPAGYLADPVTGRYVFEKKYKFVITNFRETKFLISEKRYSWEDIKVLAEKFKNKSASEAWELWYKLNP
ncbi:MAG: hypothetical protein HXX08_22745 [Chloroflexi bacterium]|uniref:Uncharacterized protein n=1 Tax=Candidatus Chlorohelix allophototropha TaxID=3003348 RepID=A0A8T7M990_9CHLR|nr:hypothetical protein [Chloroflexota bacterium]WJW68620.1 hypothetical protein OZ401_004234 [Chloroflexota bacterium L227-S17]